MGTGTVNPAGTAQARAFVRLPVLLGLRAKYTKKTKTYTLTEGGRTLGTTTTTSSGPVSIPWSTTAADNGARTPTVGVRDSAGATGSSSINVTVAN